MEVVHYTSNNNWKLKPIEISNGDYSIKPFGGLWCSPVDSNWGWKDWCKAEEYGDIDHRYSVILDLDLSNFVVINTPEDVINKLKWYKRNSWLVAIDFEAMLAKGIDGIYLTEIGQETTRFMLPYSKSLYGWDCESLVILNDRCIKSWKINNIMVLSKE